MSGAGKRKKKVSTGLSLSLQETAITNKQTSTAFPPFQTHGCPITQTAPSHSGELRPSGHGEACLGTTQPVSMQSCVSGGGGGGRAGNEQDGQAFWHALNNSYTLNHRRAPGPVTHTRVGKGVRAAAAAAGHASFESQLLFFFNSHILFLLVLLFSVFRLEIRY